jgi:aconitase A
LIHNEQPFYRTHKANLISFGILPQEFVREEDLKRISPGDRLRVRNVTHIPIHPPAQWDVKFLHLRF